MLKLTWLKNLRNGTTRSKWKRAIRCGARRSPDQAVEQLETRWVLTPSLAPIADVTLQAGSPLHIPLNGSDTEGQALTFTASSSNSLVSTFVPQNNRSLRINVTQGDPMSPTIEGEMTFQLFETRSPRATGRIIQLTNSDFYNGSIFHRVIDDFVIQGGDPNGIPPGTGGSTLGDFDDQFHPDLQHNTTGMLSFAKSFDDTNDSQFFITEFNSSNSGSVQSLRNLDSQHTVFGIQTTGESIRAAISDTSTDVNNRPDTDVVLTDVSVFVDTENGVLMLSAPEGTGSATATITVTVTDTDNNTATQTFNVTVEPDPFDNQPWLEDIPKIRTLVDTPTSFTLESFDVEGSAAAFLDEVFLGNFGLTVPAPSNANVDYSVDASTGETTVTPMNGFVTSTSAAPGGVTDITVAAGVITTEIDYQVVGIEIVDAAIPLVVSAADHPNNFEADNGIQDTFTLSMSGTRMIIDINGQVVQQAEAGSVSSLSIAGSGDDDKLIVDFSNGNPIPSGGLTFAGSTQTSSDSLELINGAFGTATYSFDNATDGTITLDSSTINFTGLEPILDNLNAADRVFTYSAVADTIVVGDDGTPTNGLSRIEAIGTAETVDFADPSNSLTINAGEGNNSVTVNDLESGVFAVTVSAGSGDDTITTGGGADQIDAGDGANDITSGDGNDVISTGSGNDMVDSGEGNDQIDSGSGDDDVDGGNGDDTIGGGDGDDTLVGGAGANVLTIAVDGNVTITATDTTGTGGTDSISGFVAVVVTGGENADLVDAGAVSIPITATTNGGNDTVIGGGAADNIDAGDGVDVVVGGQGDDVVNGGTGNDVLLGSGGKDDLIGGEGDDFLRGQGTSDDTMRGGPGNDTLDGGAGDDIIRDTNDADFIISNTQMTGNGTDTVISVERAFLVGGPSDNTLDASALFTELKTTVTLDGAGGNDSLVGSAGNDILFDGTSGNETMLAGAGDDYLFGGSGKDHLDGQEGDDTIRGQGGSNDTVIGGPGNDFIDGGAGGDKLVEFIDGTATLNDTNLISNQGTDDIFNIEAAALVGGDNADTIDTSAFSATGLNTLVGGGGNDNITGSAGGANLIVGGDGDDMITGGSVLDIIDGDAGDDVVNSGSGDDQIDGGSGNDELNGEAGNDAINGEDGDDTLNGGDDDDTIQGGAGNDVADGGSGNDGISLAAGNDVGIGNSEKDTIYGGSGNDILLGSAGADILIGGLDDDQLNGNGSSDTLVLGQGDGTAQGGDVAADPAEVDNAFMLDPLPPWVEEV